MTEDERALITALFMQTTRIYDVLLMLYFDSAGEEKALKLRELHEQGKSWCPPPFITPEEHESPE